MNKTFISYYSVISFILLSCFKNANGNGSIPVTPIYKGKYSSDIKNYEIVFPQRVNKDGKLISNLVSHRHSKRSTEKVELTFYKIPIAGVEYLIELTPNRKLISPGAIIETHGENVAKFNKRKNAHGNSTNDYKEMLESLNIKKLTNTECHFSGRVRGENTSKAALSTCHGLAGFIKIKQRFFTIEPVAEQDPFVEKAYPHIVYEADDFENSSFCHTMGVLAESLKDQIRERRESNSGLYTPLYIETLIVMDNTFVNHHRDSDCENYVLTVFNMASNLFHDASLGLTMTLTIVRIIRLEIQDDEMNLEINADAEKSLKYFQTWQYVINPGDDTHPNHHDVAVLLTRVDVCYSPSSCGLLGLTTIGKACDSKLSAALCEDNGLRLGYVIAHEIGHLLGADHDSSNSSCIGTDEDGLETIMQPHVPLTAQAWSKCSQAYFKVFIENGMGHCLLDEPEDHQFNVQDLLPGVMYNADFQCKLLITLNARECDMGSTCNSLNCHIPGYACVVTNFPPADGTHCGENMWCHDKKCLVVGERPGAIDGNWGEWSPWSDCSRTCGSGVASSVRHCDKPAPSHGGKNCIDLIRFISEEVNVSFVGKPCETGRPSFRNIQCGEFDDWVYPEDGKTHTWRAYFFHDDNPCILYCISDDKQIVALRPRVVDGTMCYKGIRDICVAGTCKSLPCDLHFDSNAIEDACGVCHGDGTGCEFSEGIETFSKLAKGLTKLVSIPSGTRNIKVEEMAPTLSRIVVRDKETKEIYVKGKNLGMFSVPGSQAWLGMTKKNQEALNIPGPVTKPISVWIQRLENVTVKWSMALPAEQQRKPEFTWDFLKWGPCSAKCGPGTQKSEPNCMEEKAGLVEETYCADMEAPPAKVRPCEIAKCEPKWMVGDWKECDKLGSGRKEKKRAVFCIKAIGEGEGESQVVADSECPKPKPHDTEFCENRRKREDTEYSIQTDNNFFDEDSSLRSDNVELGFHTKYDDYLTHFAALSVPQRKSETIPFHLISSPHFKKYFRVLQTPEDYLSGSKFETQTDLDNTLPNNTTLVQSKNKISPDFYRNTFSGNQIDVSHMQTKISEKRQRSLPQKYKKLLDSNFRLGKNNKILRHARGNFKNSHIKKYWAPRNNSLPMKIKKYCKNSKELCSKESSPFSYNKSSRLVFFKSRANKKDIHNNQFSKKGSRNSIHELFPAKENLTQLNYDSPDLINIIENMKKMNKGFKNSYLNLISKDRCEPVSEKNKVKNSKWNDYNNKALFKPINTLKPLYFSKSMNNEKLKISFPKNEKMLDQLKREFDGSGIRKVKFKPEKMYKTAFSTIHKNSIKNDNLEKWMNNENFFPCSFNCMKSKEFNMYPRKPTFRDRYKALEDFIEKRNKRFYINKMKNNNLDMKKRKSLGKKKRSSCKRRKSKAKELNAKSSLDAFVNGCGTETRNYLNNLFRDSRPKIFNKPERKAFNKKPIINTGQLVIDSDSIDNQKVEIIFQDDEEHEMMPKPWNLPQPSQSQKTLILRGKKVLEFLQSLQRRIGREAYYRAINGTGETEGNKINVIVQVPNPDKSNQQTEMTDATTASTTESSSVTTTVTTTSNTDSTVPSSSEILNDTTVSSKETESSTQTPQNVTESGDSTTSTVSSSFLTTVGQTPPTTTPQIVKQTTEQNKSKGCDDYDINEVYQNTPETTTETKKKKNKKKGKKPSRK